MSEQLPKDESVWPETVRLRDCKIHDDLGGLGQRIYTTAGAGYEKREYVRADIVADLRASLRREENARQVLADENRRLLDQIREISALADHLRWCQQCAETDVTKCDDGKPLFEKVYPF